MAVGEQRGRGPRRCGGGAKLASVEGAQPERPFPLDPAGGRMGMVDVCGRPRETVATQFALVSAARQVGMGLARGPVVRHQ